VEKERSSQKLAGWAYFFLVKGFLLFLLLIGFISGLLATDDPPDFYKTILTEAEYYYFQKRPEISREKLNKLQVEFPSFLEIGYYRLSAKLYEEAGVESEAILEYEKALFQKKDDASIALKLYSLYAKDRRIRKAFDFLRIYLALEAGDRPLRFQSLILASRLGEKKYFEFAKKRISNFGDLENEKESLEGLQKLLDKKKYSKGVTESKSLVEKFPFNKNYYHYWRIFQYQLSADSDEMEEVLISTASVFFQEKKYSFELAQFYNKRKKYHAALNLFRRTFSQTLNVDGWNMDEEILYLLRTTYFHLGWKEQAKSISILIELMRKTEHLSFEEIESKYLLNKNREITVYAIYYFSKSNPNKSEVYKERLINRDKKSGDRELMNIFPIFDYELNTEI
jgi:hypothetical protein